MANSVPPIDDTGTFRVRRSVGFGRIVESIMDVGRGILGRARAAERLPERPSAALERLCRQLLDHRGQPSGMALADEILARYQTLAPAERIAFFEQLAMNFAADPQAIIEAAGVYKHDPSHESLAALSKAIEAPRQKLFRRLNMVPNGTSRLVKLRGDLLDSMPEHPILRGVESDLRHLLIAWFNRGFLALERIDWASPANVLEKIIAYEAVHQINGWEDLRARLADDRRCFAFFHPAMPDDPLIFVEVALTDGYSDSIAPLLATHRAVGHSRDMNTAVFYSISNCHHGLRGINFGHFLIKQVVEELRRDLENVERFVTLSPVPGFHPWLKQALAEALPDALRGDIIEARKLLGNGESGDQRSALDDAREQLLRLCAHYLINVKQGEEPLDPVARFHLSNGASLARINWDADSSRVGYERSVGIMVNYAYDPKEIEKNHETYFSEGKVTASAAVKKLIAAR